MGVAAQLLLADGRFPAGGHAHSGGLEAWLAGGGAPAGVPDYVAGRLTAVAGPEAALAIAARRSALERDLQGLLDLDAEALARCASPPLRLAARRTGAQLLRTARTVWPEATILRRYADASDQTPRPIAFGAVSAAAGLSANACATAWLHDDAATAASAAVRLLAVDPALAAAWIARCGALIERLAAGAEAAAGAPRDLPAAFAPLLDARSLAHAQAKGRLFAS